MKGKKIIEGGRRGTDIVRRTAGNVKWLLRPAWRAVNPAWVQCLRSVERASIRTKAAPTRWLRRNWPKKRAAFRDAANVAIISVNYNTAEHIAHLLFSLFRVLGRDQFRRVVVVDNGSTDGSVELLAALAEAGLIEVILNRRQRYHGPALNQAMNYLARLARRSRDQAADYVWVLDSDTIVLRPDAVRDAVDRASATSAGLLGQVQYHEMPDGYAHISSLLVDPVRVWRRSIAPFYESGTPAEGLHASLRKRGVPIVDFPYRDGNYVLHLGSRTLRTIRQQADAVNRYYGWACDGNLFSFHDNPSGQEIYDAFTAAFRREVEVLDPPSLVTACSDSTPIELVGVHSVGNALCGVPRGAGRRSPAIHGTPQRAFATEAADTIAGLAYRVQAEASP